MSIHNNFPATSWIKLDGISVTKGENVYIVKDFKTNLKYIYWSLDVPNQLTASNVMLSRTSSRFLVAINNKGECILVPNEDITISFDGNSVDAITEHIWGLYEKDEEHGDRFVSVEQNVEGITQTVGQHEEELGKVNEYVSKVDQKADSINLSVQNLNREYNDDKKMQELRENVNGSIIDINSTLGIFKSQVTDIFKDNKISEDEAIEVQAQIDILEKRKLEVINQVDRVILLMELEGKLNEVTSLISQKQAFTNAIDNLVSLVDTAISDSTIVSTEITIVTDAFGKASVEINTLKNTIDQIIFLGIGGTISEELAKISMKSDEIILSVNKVEEKVDNDTAYIKNELANQIKDVSNEINNLEDTMNNSFLDGVLSESEKITLKTNLESLATEKLDTDKQYTSIYNNADLIGTSKTQLNTAYNTYVQKYNLLVDAINTVVNKEGNVDINDQSNINSCIVGYRNALGDFSSKASNAIDSIAENKSSSVDTKYAEILLSSNGIVSRVGSVESKASSNSSRLNSAESSITQLSTSISSKVSRGDVKSIIEQSPDEIKYGFNDISDYVTISTSGLTVNRGSIACDSIKASSSNPIIKLFDGNGLNCALDATSDMNEGVGNAIRLKRDNSNYIYVGGGSVAFYLTGSNNNQSALCFFSGGTNTFTMSTKGGNLVLNNGSITYNGTKLSLEGHIHHWDTINGRPSFGTNYGQIAHGNHTHSGYASSSHDHSNQYIYPSRCMPYYSESGYVGSASSPWMHIEGLKVWWQTAGGHSDKKRKENIKSVFNDNNSRTLACEDNETFENIVTLEEMHNFIGNELELFEFNFRNTKKSETLYNQLGFIANDMVNTNIGSKFIELDKETDEYVFNNSFYENIVAGALKYEIKKREKLEDEVKDLKDKIGFLTDIINKLVNN